MNTLNGLKIELQRLVQVDHEEGAVELESVCGKVFRSYRTYKVVTEEDIAGTSAMVAMYSFGEGEFNPEEYYFERNVYGSPSWSQADENALMQYN